MKDYDSWFSPAVSHNGVSLIALALRERRVEGSWQYSLRKGGCQAGSAAPREDAECWTGKAGSWCSHVGRRSTPRQAWCSFPDIAGLGVWKSRRGYGLKGRTLEQGHSRLKGLAAGKLRSWAASDTGRRPIVLGIRVSETLSNDLRWLFKPQLVAMDFSVWILVLCWRIELTKAAQKNCSIPSIVTCSVTYNLQRWSNQAEAIWCLYQFPRESTSADGY